MSTLLFDCRPITEINMHIFGTRKYMCLLTLDGVAAEHVHGAFSE